MPALTAGIRRARAAAVLNMPLSDQEATGLTRLAERLRPVFAAAERRDAADAGRLVNAMLESYRPRPGLVMDGDGTWHLHFHAAVDDPEAWWGAGCATAMAGVLSSDAWHRLGVCSASACDRVFVDLSRNGSRRFCSPACQNRTKAAALRARRRDAASGAP